MRKVVFQGKLLPLLLIAPQIAVTVIFFYWPASQAVWQSFLIQDAFGTTTEFVWFENYQVLFQDKNYYNAIGVTVVFSAPGSTSANCRSSA